MIRFIILFFGCSLLIACEQITGNEASTEMQTDVAKAVEMFCRGQKKQVEISRKISKMKENGQTPSEEIFKELEEANQDLEAYANATQKIAEKYKGQERKYAELLKEGQKKCKY